jgi:fructokinase
MGEYGQVCCIGELLIDFICTDIDRNLIEGKTFEKHAGGAPANVAATVAKLGGQASFVGKVGEDPFGHFLKQTIEQQNVDASMVILDHQFPTTLAFVSLEASGERDFVFNRGADQHLMLAEIDLEKIKKATIVHFGSATAMLEDPFQNTYFQLMNEAIESHQFVSFDPNYRSDLWRGKLAEFVSVSKTGISKADFVKVSEEELEIITGTKEKEQSLKIIHEIGAKLVAVTLGKGGTLLSNGIDVVTIPSIEINSIDSTGAGDSFVGAMLWKISQLKQPKDILEDFDRLQDFVTFANKVGAIVCTKVGAITSIPTVEEVRSFR